MRRDLYINNGEQQSGPYTEEELGEFVRSGYVTAQSQCWREGMVSWLPVCQVLPNLFPSGQSVAPIPVPVQSASLPPTPAQAEPAAPQAYPLPQPKKRSCCCSGCLVIILFIVLITGGIIGVAWYKYRQPPSPVDKEYKTIPDYFPPTAGIQSYLSTPGGRR